MNLKEARKNSGLTQDEAADMFNLKFRTYQNYENGVTTPTMEKAAEFARYFKCSIAELFDLEDGAKYSLTKDERILLSDYRKLDDGGKRSLRNTASYMAGTAPSIKKEQGWSLEDKSAV